MDSVYTSQGPVEDVLMREEEEDEVEVVAAAGDGKAELPGMADDVEGGTTGPACDDTVDPGVVDLRAGFKTRKRYVWLLFILNSTALDLAAVAALDWPDKPVCILPFDDVDDESGVDDAGACTGTSLFFTICGRLRTPIMLWLEVASQTPGKSTELIFSTIGIVEKLGQSGEDDCNDGILT